MNLERRLSELVRDALEPMITARLNDLEERLVERLAGLVQTPRDAAPPLLTQKDLATYLKVTPRTLQRTITAGEFPPAIRISPGRARWRQADIDTWLEERES